MRTNRKHPRQSKYAGGIIAEAQPLQLRRPQFNIGKNWYCVIIRIHHDFNVLGAADIHRKRNSVCFTAEVCRGINQHIIRIDLQPANSSVLTFYMRCNSSWQDTIFPVKPVRNIVISIIMKRIAVFSLLSIHFWFLFKCSFLSRYPFRPTCAAKGEIPQNQWTVYRSHLFSLYYNFTVKCSICQYSVSYTHLTLPTKA